MSNVAHHSLDPFTDFVYLLSPIKHVVRGERVKAPYIYKRLLCLTVVVFTLFTLGPSVCLIFLASAGEGVKCRLRSFYITP